MDYVITEALVGYRIAPKWDILGGIRYWLMDVDIDIQGPPPKVEEDQDWVDLVVGARVFADISEKWSFVRAVVHPMVKGQQLRTYAT